MTGGASLILTGILVGLAATALATSIASVVLTDTNPEVSRILGWVSLGSAVAGGLAQLAKSIGTLAVRLAQSGTMVARRVASKVVVALQHTRYRIARAALARRGTYVHPARARFYDASYVSKSVDPTPDYRVLAEPTQTVRDALKAFGAGDMNTVICCVTGVLSNSGALEDEDTAWANGQLNNGTNLAWGHFKISQSAAGGVLRSGGVRFR